MTNCPLDGHGQGHMTSSLFGKYVLISRKRCKKQIYLQWKTNRKWYMTNQMAATAVTLNDLEDHSAVAGLFKCNLLNICAAFYMISTDSVRARFLCIRRASCSVLSTSCRWATLTVWSRGECVAMGKKQWYHKTMASTKQWYQNVTIMLFIQRHQRSTKQPHPIHRAQLLAQMVATAVLDPFHRFVVVLSIFS